MMCEDPGDLLSVGSRNSYPGGTMKASSGAPPPAQESAEAPASPGREVQAVAVLEPQQTKPCPTEPPTLGNASATLDWLLQSIVHRTSVMSTMLVKSCVLEEQAANGPPCGEGPGTPQAEAEARRPAQQGARPLSALPGSATGNPHAPAVSQAPRPEGRRTPQLVCGEPAAGDEDRARGVRLPLASPHDRPNGSAPASPPLASRADAACSVPSLPPVARSASSPLAAAPAAALAVPQGEAQQQEQQQQDQDIQQQEQQQGRAMRRKSSKRWANGLAASPRASSSSFRLEPTRSQRRLRAAGASPLSSQTGFVSRSLDGSAGHLQLQLQLRQRSGSSLLPSPLGADSADSRREAVQLPPLGLSTAKSWQPGTPAPEAGGGNARVSVSGNGLPSSRSVPMPAPTASDSSNDSSPDMSRDGSRTGMGLSRLQSHKSMRRDGAGSDGAVGVQSSWAKSNTPRSLVFSQ